jgi:hypothetical protein
MLASPTRFIILGLTALAVVGTLPAQTPTPNKDQLKSWVAIRQQRVDLLREEIKQMDVHLESRLDVLIGTLTTIRDSKDSRTKVARIKEDTGKRLLKTIEYYDQKRAAFRQQAANPQYHLTAEDKRKIASGFDARIDKRAQQLIALSQSMPSHQDYERYKATGSGWYGTQYERNQDFEQNRRMTTHSNAQRDALTKQLDASIARLDRIGRSLREQLAATTDPAQRKERAADISKNDALIAERQTQRRELLKPSTMAAREVAQKEAVDLDQSLRKSIDALRRDFNTLFARFNSYVAELSALRATEKAHAAAEHR